MLEQCPTCTAKELFTTNICPRCQADKTAPHPIKVVEWRLRNQRTEREQEESKILKKRNVWISVAIMLIVGSFFVARSAHENSRYIRSLGYRHTPVVGLTIAAGMKIFGASLLLIGIFRGRS